MSEPQNTTDPAPLHQVQLPLQRRVLIGQHVGLALRLLPASPLIGKLGLEGPEGAAQRRLLLLAPLQLGRRGVEVV